MREHQAVACGDAAERDLLTGSAVETAQVTSLPSMLGRFGRMKRKAAFLASDPEEFRRWQGEARSILKELMGLGYMEPPLAAAQVTETVRIEPGIMRKRILLPVEPGVVMPVYALIPDRIKAGEIQCFVAAAGHGSGGKYSTAGCREILPVRRRLEENHTDYGLQLARRGYAVFCPDSRGFGERQEKAARESGDLFCCSCAELAHMAEPLGMTVAGMMVWDLMRLLDYIQSGEWREGERTSAISPSTDRIGAVGFSGGGMQVLYLAALDDRVGMAVISGYMYGVRDSLLEMNRNCSCNYIPHLWEYFDMGDVGALLAPRPVVIQSGRRDPLNGARGIANVLEQMETVRRAYRLFGREDAVVHQVHEFGHVWDERVWEIIDCL